MFERAYLQQLIKRIKEPRSFVQVIMGPRQVGKTTLLNQLTQKAKLPFHFVSTDAVSAAEGSWLNAQWETARIQMDQQKSTEFLLIIDEIQNIYQWSEIVKKNWDTDTRSKINLKVILLGSSRLLLQKGLTESLAGRFETMYMGHWSFAEMKEAFGWTLDQYIWFGGYPGSAILIKDEVRWKNYVRDSLIETSISKDILMMSRIDKPALMKRMFELGCHYSGQILSYTKVLGQLTDAGNTTTLSHYLDLMDTAGLLAGIEKYSGKEVRKRSSSPKFQVHNSALISAQRNENFQEIKADPAVWGRMVESSVGAYLINQSYTSGLKLNYWRESNEEVDFVLEHKGKTMALEISSGASHGRSGMTAFQKQYPKSNVLLIGKSGLPLNDFLTINSLDLFK